MVWVTRAEPGAIRTAERLRAAGFTPVTAPLIETCAVPFAPPDRSTFDALAFTSATAVSLFAETSGASFLDHPVFAVGDATATAAVQAGFTRVLSAHGDGAALGALILAETEPDVRVLHPAAARPAFDLVGALRASGRTSTMLPVYETRTVADLPLALKRAVEAGAVRAILLHSPAAARALATLDLVLQGDVVVAALSTACATPLAALGLKIAIAERPDEAGLLAALESLRPLMGSGLGADALGNPGPRR